jgi:hypothetical protein
MRPGMVHTHLNATTPMVHQLESWTNVTQLNASCQAYMLHNYHHQLWAFESDLCHTILQEPYYLHAQALGAS